VNSGWSFESTSLASISQPPYPKYQRNGWAVPIVHLLFAIEKVRGLRFPPRPRHAIPFSGCRKI
jgi:hypothetical protein